MDPNSKVEPNELSMNRAQIALVLKVVRIYGFKGLTDYETYVSAKTIANIPDFFQRLNALAKDIDHLFPVHEINLRKSDFVVGSYTIAMNMLRTLLTCIHVPWESKRTKDSIYVRLVPLAHAEEHFAQISLGTIDEANDITSNLFLEIEKVYPMYMNEGDTVDPVANLACVEYRLSGDHRKYIKSICLDGYVPGDTYCLVIGGTVMYIKSGLTEGSELLPAGIPCFPLAALDFHDVVFRFTNVDLSFDQCRRKSSPVPVIVIYNVADPQAGHPSCGQFMWPSLCACDKQCNTKETWFCYMNGMCGLTTPSECQSLDSNSSTANASDASLPRYNIANFNQVYQGKSRYHKYNMTGYLNWNSDDWRGPIEVEFKLKMGFGHMPSLTKTLSWDDLVFGDNKTIYGIVVEGTSETPETARVEVVVPPARSGILFNKAINNDGSLRFEANVTLPHRMIQIGEREQWTSPTRIHYTGLEIKVISFYESSWLSLPKEIDGFMCKQT